MDFSVVDFNMVSISFISLPPILSITKNFYKQSRENGAIIPTSNLERSMFFKEKDGEEKFKWGMGEKEIFDNLIECAKRIKEKADVSCRHQCFLELIRAILRPLQSELLLGALEEGEQTNEKIFDKEESIRKLFEVDVMNRMWRLGCEKEFDVSRHELCFYKDIIFDIPWHRGPYDSYIEALCNFGSGKPQEWKQDIGNHQVVLWLPWRIAFAENGKHSIAAGILNATSTPLKPTAIYDMSSVLDLIDTDGEHYYYKETKEIIAKVESGRYAAVFKIGCYIRECELKS
ncbi:hypothetical protein NHP190002_06560 [Helicobacter ailurogastricus]|uniref:DUF6710 family protein n=1 Tax=Helicobacter ailurogastricus TaxID=1578720 RepID=UPI00244D8690|nr:DUF6710 family protein [Helicobacter ailurogastricus]GMB89975.1 hypothetical protein NHP190002_06560 [Helicobacter ailurogastricus]